MIAKNPHFQQRERSAFQLGHLLRDLPASLDLTAGGNAADMTLRLEAAERHAENYGEILLDGIESLGRVMWSAGENEEWPVAQRDVARIGALISQLAIQLQFLDEFRASANDRLNETSQKGGRI